jgi:hypothetical protein
VAPPTQGVRVGPCTAASSWPGLPGRQGARARTRTARSVAPRRRAAPRRRGANDVVVFSALRRGDSPSSSRCRLRRAAGGGASSAHIRRSRGVRGGGRGRGGGARHTAGVVKWPAAHRCRSTGRPWDLAASPARWGGCGAGRGGWVIGDRRHPPARGRQRRPARRPATSAWAAILPEPAFQPRVRVALAARVDLRGAGGGWTLACGPGTAAGWQRGGAAVGTPCSRTCRKQAGGTGEQAAAGQGPRGGSRGASAVAHIKNSSDSSGGMWDVSMIRSSADSLRAGCPWSRQLFCWRMCARGRRWRSRRPAAAAARVCFERADAVPPRDGSLAPGAGARVWGAVLRDAGPWLSLAQRWRT